MATGMNSGVVWIFECIKRFYHFVGGFSNVSSVFITLLVDFRMYQAFLLLFGWIFNCIKHFQHFFGEFSRSGDPRPRTEDRKPGTGDRGPETGDWGPGTGDRGPDAGDWGPGTGDRALGRN